MESEYREERRKLKTRFAILYLSSIIVLSIVFAVLWMNRPPVSNTISNEAPAEDDETITLLNMDKSLHAGLKNLDELDMNYSKLLTESANAASLDSLKNLIQASQLTFSHLLDSMYNKKSSFKNPENAERSDSLISNFIAALNYRKSNSSLRMALGNDKNSQGGSFAVLQLKATIENKEDSIKDLREQLKVQKQYVKNPLPAEQNNQSNQEIESLQSNIKTLKDSLENLMALYNSAIKDNRSLTSQLKVKSTATKQDAAAMSDKINALNEKISDMNGELALAKIDCNLTRANGKDIIYNSRQRKDLLQESLTSLKNLSASDNPVIQRKVKEKMQLLQSIAATVRD
ncbi:MAG: hypothetical protein M3Z92_11710 [Bacteroidota bacterium]|nr:hypothetical protein [Bacteroidota bacterium]